jgi:TPR repeat protein
MLAHGVSRDFPQAAKWYRMAAEQGHADAQYNLGVLYDRGDGRGIAQDFQEAAKWYRMAAIQGNAEAQFNLGILYSRGKGVPLDLVQAYVLFDLASANGDADAIESRDTLAQHLRPADIQKAKALVRNWKAKP